MYDLAGKRFGKILVIRKSAAKNSSNDIVWTCYCDCGTTKDIRGSYLRDGTTKSCGCLKNKWSPFRYYWRQIMYAKHAPKDVRVTVADIEGQWNKQGGICPYTGWRLSLYKRGSEAGKKKRYANQASLDRIDSSQGYENGNIQFIALIANYAKNSFDEEVMKHFCKTVARKCDKGPSIEEQSEINQRIIELKEALGDA